MPVAAHATASDWGEIILPITPPLALAAPVSSGLIPSCSAAAFCRPPKRTLLDVSEPVRKTPSQPRTGEMRGKARPALVHRSEERRVGKEGRSRWSPYH